MTDSRTTYEILNAKSGNGVRILYERYGRKLYAYAVNKWQLDEDESWDLVYKTLYKVLDAYSACSFASEQKFAAFVFTAFINLLRNHYRDSRKRRSETVPLDDSHGAIISPGEENPDSPEMRIMKDSLDGLEDWERMLLLLRSQDLPYSEITRLTGKPESQLKVYYMRLKKKLAEMINRKLNEIKEQSHGKSA